MATSTCTICDTCQQKKPENELTTTSRSDGSWLYVDRTLGIKVAFYVDGTLRPHSPVPFEWRCLNGAAYPRDGPGSPRSRGGTSFILV